MARNAKPIAGLLLATLVAAGLMHGATAAENEGPVRDERYYASAAYDSGDMVGARKLLEIHAQKGNIDSQFDVALMYLEGLGGPKEFDRAVAWLKKAAVPEKSPSWRFCLRNVLCEIAAMDRLGVLYARGEGGLRDDAEALKWFQKAAALDHLESQISLAIFYRDGRGTAPNPELARQWFLKAAEAGNVFAQASVGAMMLRGEGGEKDVPAAIDWLRQAAEEGDVVAHREIGKLLVAGKGMEKDVTAGKEHLQQASAAGDDEAAAILKTLD